MVQGVVGWKKGWKKGLWAVYKGNIMEENSACFGINIMHGFQRQGNLFLISNLT
jgi:hypothetical protein